MNYEIIGQVTQDIQDDMDAKLEEEKLRKRYEALFSSRTTMNSPRGNV
jgi:hypothetical protein